MPDAQSLTLNLEYAWTPVLDDNDQPYTFPSPLGFRIRGEWARPAVYRWAIKIGNKIDSVHIGEADDLSRRIYQYLNPGAAQQANAKVKSALAQQALRGGVVTLDALTVTNGSLNNQPLGKDALREHSVRRAIESLLTLEARKSGIKTL